ncbi:hypothetical protein JQN72_09220 [Phycicoccus sp. CSK15P-2]|uniref:hypothetical protein n=1 Tax=Phycicoccus sp. CSK15P-2 TaxID=2807627 RepID=UPI001950EC3C|nr:hypothetical protein [Phycicoccus sp. CSK15P-2]MBM6404419.1 hypothetical protein [Phycicoccus sp. CSK15P-2]
MTRPDPLQALQDADPVAHVDLSRVDHAALTDLRDAVVRTGRAALRPVAPRRRGHRRGVVAGGLALALVGGGAGAYAAHDRWVSTVDLTCMSTWTDPASSSPRHSTGGPPITEDPVADCQEYQALAGLTPIVDPVALDYGGGVVVVAPADQVPDDAPRAVPDTVDAQALTRLDHSLQDYVDGGRSRCFDTESAFAWARRETERVGLRDLPVVEQELGEDTPRPGPCASFVIGDRELLVSTRRGMDPSTLGGPHRPLHRLRDELRTRVAQTCIPLPEAEDVVADLLAEVDHSPTAAATDESLGCTEVDLVIGGTLQVFLSGPSA